jgi:hypothetical protein
MGRPELISAPGAALFCCLPKEDAVARRTRAQWAKELGELGRKSARSLIELGKGFVRAKAELPHGEFTALVEKDLGLDLRFAQKLMQIARNRRLVKASNLTSLPRALSALVVLSRLPGADLDAAFASGEIGPSTTAKQARRFVTVTKVTADRRFTSYAYVKAPDQDEERPASGAISQPSYTPKFSVSADNVVPMALAPPDGFARLVAAWRNATEEERARFRDFLDREESAPSIDSERK